MWTVLYCTVYYSRCMNVLNVLFSDNQAQELLSLIVSWFIAVKRTWQLVSALSGKYYFWWTINANIPNIWARSVMANHSINMPSLQPKEDGIRPSMIGYWIVPQLYDWTKIKFGHMVTMNILFSSLAHLRRRNSEKETRNWVNRIHRAEKCRKKSIMPVFFEKRKLLEKVFVFQIPMQTE